MRTIPIVVALVACGGKSEDAPATDRQASTPRHRPASSKGRSKARQDALIQNPYDAVLPVGWVLADAVEKRFASRYQKLVVLYDGTNTLFFRFENCRPDELRDLARTIGAAELAKAGFEWVACDDTDVAVAVSTGEMYIKTAAEAAEAREATKVEQDERRRDDLVDQRADAAKALGSAASNATVDGAVLVIEKETGAGFDAKDTCSKAELAKIAKLVPQGLFEQIRCKNGAGSVPGP